MTWAARIALADAATLDALRLNRAVRALVVEDQLWLKGQAAGEAVESALRKAPGTRRFDVDEENRLRPAGARVAVGRLPDGDWLPLEQVLAPRPQTAALAGELPPPVELRIVRGRGEREANALLTGLTAFVDWAAAAPAVRLAKLTFAVSDDGRVLVRGRPLPPIDGVPLAEEQGVAVACGHAWEPAVDAAALRSLFGLDGNDMILLTDDGEPERIAGDQFAPASRSAARLSLQAAGGLP